MGCDLLVQLLSDNLFKVRAWENHEGLTLRMVNIFPSYLVPPLSRGPAGQSPVVIPQSSAQLRAVLQPPQYILCSLPPPNPQQQSQDQPVVDLLRRSLWRLQVTKLVDSYWMWKPLTLSHMIRLQSNFDRHESSYTVAFCDEPAFVTLQHT